MQKQDVPTTLADWAAGEVERLMLERKRASTPEERARVDLALAMVCGTAQRYGAALAETAEL